MINFDDLNKEELKKLFLGASAILTIYLLAGVIH